MLPKTRWFRSILRTTPLLGVALIWSCSEASRAPDNDSGRMDQAFDPQDQLLLASAKIALPPTGITATDLPQAGGSAAQTWTRYCMTCHPLPTPLAHSATDWPRVLRRMWLRMGMIDSSFGIQTPTTAERFAILAYADSNALQVANSALPDLPGRALFIERCAQCHELADPYQHSPEDWLAVVRRMMGHMEEITGTTLSPSELTQISGYLQNVSGPTP